MRYPRTMHFTKTNLMAGLQCPKHLHLMIHHKEHATKTKTPASITGEVVEAHAEREFIIKSFSELKGKALIKKTRATYWSADHELRVG